MKTIRDDDKEFLFLRHRFLYQKIIVSVTRLPGSKPLSAVGRSNLR
jgi:hypothetical protein